MTRYYFYNSQNSYAVHLNEVKEMHPSNTGKLKDRYSGGLSYKLTKKNTKEMIFKFFSL